MLTDLKIIQGLICPYCGKDSRLVDSSVIYGKSYGLIYLCKPCDAYCGVHKGTTNALGRLADRQLREWKKEAHTHFDVIWKERYKKGRTKAYKWLSRELNIPFHLTHIGMFDVAECKKTIEVCQAFIKQKNLSNV